MEDRIPRCKLCCVLEGGIGPDLLEDYEGFFKPADSTPNGLRAFKTKRIKYNYREFDSKITSGVNLKKLKFIQTLLFGTKIFLTVIMSQCIMITFGMMRMQNTL